MIDVLNQYDWKKVFEVAGDTHEGDDDCYSVDNYASVSPAIESTASTEPLLRKGVKRIIAHSDGENDGPSWIMVFEHNDGRFAFISAGCDYTGWDCQSGGHVIVDTDLDHLIRFGLGEEDRSRLGLPLPA